MKLMDQNMVRERDHNTGQELEQDQNMGQELERELTDRLQGPNNVQ